MWRELALGLPLLTNYARIIEAAVTSPTYQLGPAIGGVGQASVGSAGTVSSEGLTQTAQMLQSIVNAAPPAAAGCDTTPIILTTIGAGQTWTAIATCTTITAQAWGPGQNGGTVGLGGRGGGFGQKQFSVTPGSPYGVSIGGPADNNNTFICNVAPASCTAITSGGVQAGGTSGNSIANPNVGTNTHNGGAGGAANGLFSGGGGGAGGPTAAGAAGQAGQATPAGGNGGQGDVAVGGAGGAGGNAGNSWTAGTGGTGVNVSSHGAGGGGGGNYSSYNIGRGGLWGGGAGGGWPGHLGTGGQGGIILTPVH